MRDGVILSSFPVRQPAFLRKSPLSRAWPGFPFQVRLARGSHSPDGVRWRGAGEIMHHGAVGRDDLP